MTSWDYMTNMWFGCTQSTLTDWSFPNGTLVSAESYEDALCAIKRYKLSRNKSHAYQTEQGRWTVQFDRDISVSIEAPDQAEAVRRASWQFYLDKREV